jgi:uncharacterized protein (DUF1501 family)
MFSRRDFLRHSTLIALAPTVPGFLAATARAAAPERGGRLLVVIQLDGGNDGINTAVPYADEGYARHRQRLRLPGSQLAKVNDRIGLHPALRDLAKLLEDGRLSIVQGVGYPNPNRSHFESMAIWHTARFGEAARDGLGWIGRGLDAAKPSGGVPGAVFVGGGQLPAALRGRRSLVSSLARPEDFILTPEARMKPPRGEGAAREDLLEFVRRNALDAYLTADRMAEVVKGKDGDARYPNTQLAGALRLIARLIKADVGTRVFYARRAGYDTHQGQLGTHFNLLSELGGAIKAFHDDLSAAKLSDRVTVMTFSEFGRTVAENGSAGTDHGTAGLVFVAGPRLKTGLVGATPSLMDLDPKHGDLKVGIDFRRVYATLLEGWLGLPSESSLGGVFERLPLLRV